jgi:predicted nucleic acid-binding protein
MFAVVLDTCVLWPSLQRDFLLSLAVEGLYRPLWSDTILDELEFHEARKLATRGDADPPAAAFRAERLVGVMKSAFDDALVEGWEPHEGTFGLPDPDDEHVLAAAVVGGAGAIVTNNVRDFPQARIPEHIQILKPAQFAADTVAVSPELALHAVTTMVERRRTPPETLDQVLQKLVDRYSMFEAVELVRSAR